MGAGRPRKAAQDLFLKGKFAWAKAEGLKTCNMTVCKLGWRREPIQDRRNEELLTDGISLNSEILPL